VVNGRGCNPHRSLWRHWWRHNSETIRDREKRRPARPMKSMFLCCTCIFSVWLLLVCCPFLCLTLNVVLLSRNKYTVSQKTSHLWLAIELWRTWMDFDIFFGRNVTDKVDNQKTLYYVTSNNLCFCTTWQNAETRKSHISINWIVLHTMHMCAIFLKETIVICDAFDSV